MIECKICNRKMKKMITNTHLKKHDITLEEYKKEYGETVSNDYRKEKSKANSGINNPNFGNKWTDKQKQNISIQNKGNIAWNKGKKITNKKHLENVREGIKEREKKYQEGILERYRSDHSEETKSKISNSIKEYARNNPEEMSERAKKSITTRIENGHGILTFKGRHHTEEAKKIISEKSKIVNKEKHEQSLSKKIEMARSIDLEVIKFDDKKVYLKCNKCDSEFNFTNQYFIDSKFFKEICPTCYPRKVLRSQAEKELFGYIKSICPDARHSDRSIISPREIDIVIPSKKIGIEYNGLYWHSEEMNKSIDRNIKSDYEKMILVDDQDYRLVTIYEDEFINKKDIVKSRLKNILGQIDKKIYARNTKINEITSKEVNNFLRINHIQSSGRSNIRLGLFYKDELVSVMTFSKSNVSRRIEQWELDRFCSKIDINVVGGASKLFKHFIRNYNVKNIISYADRRWSAGNLYRSLGFKLVHHTPPNYWYFKPNEIKRIHRYSLRKKSSDDQELTEYQNRLSEGYQRIWDCGSSKWIWERGI